MNFKNNIINNLIIRIKETFWVHPEKTTNNEGDIKINFNYSSTTNYLIVQKQLSELIQLHLKEMNCQYEISEREYKNGCLNFTWFLRRKADVVMSHGLADKNYLWVKHELTGDYFINHFKVVLVPGLWMKNRIMKSKVIKINPDYIIPVGWPRIDVLRNLQKKYVKESPNNKITLLWAPTHDYKKKGKEKKSLSSYPDFENYAKDLKNKYNVLYSPHPRNRKNKEPTMDKILRADIVISDFGTMVYEAWALGKPVIFPRWILGDRIIEYLRGSAEAYIFKNRIGYHPESYKEMLEIIKSGPVVDQKVHEFMDEYLDNYRDGGNSAKKIAETLIRLSEIDSL
jgi:hypothetical protein